jgi:simple sugar transport system substrate-binding protein
MRIMSTRIRMTALAAALVSAVAAVLVVSAAASSSHRGVNAPVRIAFINDGPVNDGGWTEAIYLGQQAIDKQFGSKIKTTYATNVFGNDITRVAEQYIHEGYNVIVDGGCAGCAQIRALAVRYPNVKFLMADGNPPFRSNEAALFPKYWQSGYLMGVTAGLLTKSNKIGTVASFNIPLGDSIINAYALGCQSVDPKCEVLMDVQNSWLLPAKTSQMANSLIDQGADFVWSYLNDTTTARVSEQRGAWTGGAYLDQLQFAPKKYATGEVFMWNSPFAQQVTALLNGTFKSGLYLSSLGQGFDIGKVWGPNVPASVKAKVLALKSKIKGGWNPFTGPIYDQKGKLRVQKGQALGDDYLYYQWNWLVKGVK